MVQIRFEGPLFMLLNVMHYLYINDSTTVYNNYNNDDDIFAYYRTKNELQYASIRALYITGGGNAYGCAVRCVMPWTGTSTAG